MEKKYLLILILVVFLSWRLSSISQSIHSFIFTLTPIINHPLASYDEKMSYKYPKYWNLISTIKNLTDENSIIYLPQASINYGEDLWPILNIPMTSALLYPRKVLIVDVPKKDPKFETYIVFCNSYPNDVIKAHQVHVINNSRVETYLGDFMPEHYRGNKLGLIRL